MAFPPTLHPCLPLTSSPLSRSHRRENQLTPLRLRGPHKMLLLHHPLLRRPFRHPESPPRHQRRDDQFELPRRKVYADAGAGAARPAEDRGLHRGELVRIAGHQPPAGVEVVGGREDVRVAVEGLGLHGDGCLWGGRVSDGWKARVEVFMYSNCSTREDHTSTRSNLHHLGPVLLPTPLLPWAPLAIGPPAQEDANEVPP